MSMANPSGIYEKIQKSDGGVPTRPCTKPRELVEGKLFGFGAGSAPMELLAEQFEPAGPRKVDEAYSLSGLADLQYVAIADPPL